MEFRETNGMEKGNMSALEEKVDALMRYCVAETAHARQYYHVGLRAMLSDEREDDLTAGIDGALAGLGVPDHLLVYRYLQCAIAMAVA